MLDEADLPSGWRLWSATEDRLVLAYRPDVFDGDRFEAACLPTIYVTRGGRRRRPGAPSRSAGPGAEWVVTLFLEPAVSADPETYETRSAAAEGARKLAERFASGAVDYRALYQVPREDYFGRLDELTGREE